MKCVLFLIWILLGSLLFFSGCQASLTAAKLEAAVTLDNPSVPTVTVLNQIDKDSINTQQEPNDAIEE